LQTGRAIRFLKLDPFTAQKPPQGVAGDDDATIAQPCEKRVQGKVWLLAKAREKPIPLAFEEIGPVAAYTLGSSTSGGARSLRPLHDAGYPFGGGRLAVTSVFEIAA
jgi:hypothetical protein